MDSKIIITPSDLRERQAWTLGEQKKYIGNAVEVTMARVLCEALGYALERYEKQKAA